MNYITDYAKKISDKSIQFAPLSAELSDYTPYQFVKPLSTDIYNYTLSCYDVVDGVLQPIWERHDKPAQVHEYSKLKILIKLTELGYWQAVKQMLSTNVIDGTQTKYIELWDAAQVFKSNDKYFIEGLAAVKSLTGASDQKLAEALSECIV